MEIYLTVHSNDVLYYCFLQLHVYSSNVLFLLVLYAFEAQFWLYVCRDAQSSFIQILCQPCKQTVWLFATVDLVFFYLSCSHHIDTAMKTMDWK